MIDYIVGNSVEGVSDALVDWSWRCIVIDSVNSGDEGMGLAESIVLSGPSSIGVVGEEGRGDRAG